ncbi:MAG: class I SAM-dependent methyltransferase [Pseudolabrys sp.]|nr:class I SAM-dependent methyltransferase [Pseudolabrys sp.]
MPASDYRERIYSSYNTGRKKAVAPNDLGGLEPRLPELRRMIRASLDGNRDSEILDLGCGYGAFLHALRQLGYKNARGVDGSMEQVEAAAQLGIAGVEYGHIMPTLAETKTSSLDTVVTFDVIEHFKKDELIALVDEVRRVLKEGGRWIIHIPNAEGPFSSRIRYSDFTHELAFTRVSIDQLLRASGFVDVKCMEDGPTVRGVRSAIRYCLWRAIRVVLLGYLAIETGSFDRNAIFSQNFLAVGINGPSGSSS